MCFHFLWMSAVLLLSRLKKTTQKKGPALCDPTVHGILQARILEWEAFPFSRDVFQAQGSNPGLPHCRWILYQLSHQGSPLINYFNWRIITIFEHWIFFILRQTVALHKSFIALTVWGVVFFFEETVSICITPQRHAHR